MNCIRIDHQPKADAVEARPSQGNQEELVDQGSSEGTLQEGFDSNADTSAAQSGEHPTDHAETGPHTGKQDQGNIVNLT